MKRSRQAISIVFTLVAMAAGYSSNAATQPSRVQPASADDLRAVYANAADVADGKRVAETSCIGCHAVNGHNLMSSRWFVYRTFICSGSRSCSSSRASRMSFPFPQSLPCQES